MIMNFFAFFASAHAEVLVSLFIIFTAAKLAAEIFERLKQPAVVGEILAGVLIGPSMLALVKQSDFTNAMAEIGVILLLFTVGLEINPGALFKVGGKALLTAILGVIVPFIAGWVLMYLWGGKTIEGVFIGAA
ncbi:MAG: cation:proton antiporter, partial [Blastocatellia bacterium]|nr:cation:proton antiporter [Blastocatellia bacterium]